MGGAQRGEKRRKQTASGGPPASVTAQRSNRTPLIVVAAVLVAAAVVGVVVWPGQRGSEQEVAPTYTASASGGVVTVGTGPVVVDVYEDYICPFCERFEQRSGNEMTQALNAGQITVRYHSIAILDRQTTPPGYSTRAANAALCSVQAGIFPAYHAKLYDEQPAEGSAGLSDDQLVRFGTELGAQGDFAQCVTDGQHASAVAAETRAATTNPALQTNGRFGTPTVTVNGTKADISDSNWLKDAIAAGAR